MKCRKCGCELRETDKFCPECGIKVELSEPDLKKSKLNSNFRSSISKKSLIGALLSLAFIILVVVIGFISSREITITDSTDSTEIKYNTKTINEMTYKYNAEWDCETDSDGSNYEDDDGNKVWVKATVLDRYVTYDDVVDNVSDAEEWDDVSLIMGDGLDLYNDDVSSYYYHNYYRTSYEPYFEHYIFVQKNTIFTITFSSESDEDETEFNICKEYMLYNLKFDESSFVAPITEEPTTKKPTEPPTEKATERRILNNTSTDGFWAEGSGDYVANGLKVTGYGVLHVEYYGKGNFSVTSYENDEYDDLLVNEIGNYSGDVLIDHSGTFELEISGEGSWSITSSGLSVDDKTSFSGSGDSVTGITSHSGGSWNISHTGEDNFVVVQYGLDEGYMDLLVNEIGNYNGTVKAESGDDIFFEVTADGNWSIERN